MSDLLKMAERCEAHAERLTRDAFARFDDMRYGDVALRQALADAVSAFAVAAALRAKAARAPSDHLNIERSSDNG
jgi:hypothetical protein